MKRYIAVLLTLLLFLSLCPAALAGSKMQVQTDFRIEVAEGDYSQTAGLDKNVLNILLLGTDADGLLNAGRSDCMIVCSIHKDSGLVQLSSIARDLYVAIPGAGVFDCINTANAYGGPRLAMKTVNEALGLNIEHYVTVNFAGFERIVDVLGGIGLEITAEDAEKINRQSPSAQKVSAGLALLDGRQALAFVRIRSDRQRAFLSAVVRKVTQEQNIGQIIDLIRVCLDYVDYSLGFKDIVRIAWTVLTQGVTLEMHACPGEGEFASSSVAGKGSMLIGNDAMRENLHRFIYRR